MSLPETYLTYPHRAYGMDQKRYDWRTCGARPPIAWPQGRTLAAMIVVPIEHHMLNPTGKPFKHPGAMVTPYPDLRHYTTRDYGLRVGVFRILKELKTAGLKAVFPINAALLQRARPLVDAILADGHEIAAHGLDTDHIHWGGLDLDVETKWVAATRAAFTAAGLHPRVWMSPARQQSFATLDVIAAGGFDVCLDWEHDSVPVAMRTDAGMVSAVPLSSELDDRLLLGDRRQTEDEWVDQILEAARYMTSEAPRYGGQVLGFSLTPYIAGQPFRIAALRRLLGALADDGAVWSASASEIADAANAS
ncbi:MAG: polysaccharide deacetylase family protein [Pseudomonadota bacterium]|uniref:polysaccharide deacetylase family protein n=1 Tax=Phenylobacterium sp. TaxID=1871053 RepID=UPI0025F18384|nr:polysaccharide deacetylase family protein [Phenylobacterium sp.]MBT9470528.1 polysaccharide deacetylase family protein [Phenylobacterium sp.]